MRLTLRTLLAYMDDILDPADYEELGHRVEESEFATSLLHRSRDVIRRLRLGAPQLHDDKSLDSNTVAEYLDNTLPSDHVVDFERVCLESDLHLAEVVSCHQILTLVLGEPAEIDEKLRQRIHDLIGPSDAADEATPPAAVEEMAAATADEQSYKERRKPEVPDYLRAAAQSRTRRAALAGLILVAAAIAIAAWVWWPAGDTSQVAKNPPNSDTSTDTTPAGNAEQPAATGAEPAPPFPDSAPAGDANLQYPDGVSPPDASSTEPFPPPDATASDAGAATTPPSEFPAAGPDAPVVEDVPVVGFPSLAPDQPPFGQPPGDQPPGDQPPGDQPPAAPAASARVGVYSGAGTEVLVRYNPDRGAWYRLSSGAPLLMGDRLLALPTFRPSLTISSVVAVQLAGGSEVRIVDDSQGPIPTVELVHGRLILLNTGLPGGRVRLSLGGRLAEIAFGDDQATVAIDLRRMLSPGENPETVSANVLVDVYAAAGKFQWRIDGQSVDVEAPLHWRLPDMPAAGGATDVPNWLWTEQNSELESRARGPLSQSLDIALDAGNARSVNLALSELVTNRRTEVRSLAAECSMYIGEFAPFIRALDDPDQRASWTQHLATLRRALALGPEVAAQVREALERERLADGALLYRLVWGYNRQQLEGGELANLINLLEHERLDVRVLAFENLRDLTDKRLNYVPYSTPQERQGAVRIWRERLDRGELQIVSPPEAEQPPAE